MFNKIKNNNIISLLELYRFISVFLTISIYLVHGIVNQYKITLILFMVFCVIISAILLNYLYKTSFEIMVRLQFLIILEILGISFLIILTGGLSSPFIWCFLNPLLVISYYMPAWSKRIFLVSSFVLLGAIGFYVERQHGIWSYLLNNSNILLCFILLIILVNILFEYNRQIIKNQEELQAANKGLEGYNSRIKGMIDDMLFMFGAAQTTSIQTGNNGIVDIIFDFAQRVLPAGEAFFIPEGLYEDEFVVYSKTLSKDVGARLINKLKNLNGVIKDDNVLESIFDEETIVLFIKITNIKNYGTIGLLVPKAEYIQAVKEYDTSLLLISQLGATFFEKIETDAVSYELAVADEQNRIADDIHDSVIQRLFAISCVTYDILKKWGQLSDEFKQEQVTLIKDTIQSSLKDLRSTIYNLSSKKQKVELFKENVQSYLIDMERLSGVRINLDMSGEPDSLALNVRKALYRIITECTGNAIRHAKCRNISVALHIGDVKTDLTICDDGIGLDIEKAEQEKNGLGLYNIKSLVRMFNGSINISVNKGNGTNFVMVFMNSDIMRKLDEE